MLVTRCRTLVHHGNIHRLVSKKQTRSILRVGRVSSLIKAAQVQRFQGRELRFGTGPCPCDLLSRCESHGVEVNVDSVEST